MSLHVQKPPYNAFTFLGDTIYSYLNNFTFKNYRMWIKIRQGKYSINKLFMQNKDN